MNKKRFSLLTLSILLCGAPSFAQEDTGEMSLEEQFEAMRQEDEAMRQELREDLETLPNEEDWFEPAPPDSGLTAEELMMQLGETTGTAGGFGTAPAAGPQATDPARRQVELELARARQEVERGREQMRYAERRVDLLQRQLQQVSRQAEQAQRRTTREYRGYEYDFWETEYGDRGIYTPRESGHAQQRGPDQLAARARRLESDLARARREAERARQDVQEAQRLAQRYERTLRAPGATGRALTGQELQTELELIDRELQIRRGADWDQRLEPPAAATSPPRTTRDPEAMPELPTEAEIENLEAVEPQ